MRIDSHHHLWKYNSAEYGWITEARGPLRRDFLPEDLATLLHETGIDAAVTVHAREMLEETEWLLDLTEQHEFMRGVVGWVPLVQPDVARHLERFAAHRRLKGVRHVLHDEPDDYYMLRKDFNRGVGLLERFGLVYDILIYEHHLPQTLEFVDRHPNQVFVVDHIAKPRIRDRVMSPWREKIGELAKRENVYCKVSGMVTEADWGAWTPQDLEPYFDVVLSRFGPQRLMFGSDWPVATLAASYELWATTFSRAIAALSPAEQERIWSGTAIQAYRL